MLDSDVFEREIRILEERFRHPLSEGVFDRYYEVLSVELTDEQFEQAARIVFTEDSYFPSPRRLLNAAAATKQLSDTEVAEIVQRQQLLRKAADELFEELQRKHGRKG